MQQMDVNGAYLNGQLEEEIYMIWPPVYEDGSGAFLFLLHSLYGLKQSGRAWYHKLKETLLKHNFKHVAVEHGLYIMQKDEKLQIILLWVDDLLHIGPDPDSTNEIKAIHCHKFDMHDLGEPRHLIGMEISRDYCASTVTLSQKQYIQQILEKHWMINAKPFTTPMDPNIVLIKWTEAPNDSKACTLYAAMIRSLMYAAIGTRPDISFAVQTLSQFTQNPGPDHWVALK